jgi:hypothetical protein
MIIGIYDDDCLVLSKEKEINQLIADLNPKGFSLKVEFVLDTKTFCLQIKSNLDSYHSGKLKVFSDSDWAGDPERRISVTGFIVYLQNVPVCWRTKAQRGVTLPSSEAEYVAMSEAVKEIRFIYFILNDIGIEVELPIVVKTDNVGALL